MRPTDFCHLDDDACTRTSRVPGSLRGFHRVDTPRSLGLRAAYRGTGCFTTPENASADCSWTRAALPRLHTPLFRWVDCERGRFLPTAPVAIEPLTPLSPLPLPRNVGTPSRSFELLAFSSLFAFPA
jgi:hypothetical protein